MLKKTLFKTTAIGVLQIRERDQVQLQILQGQLGFYRQGPGEGVIMDGKLLKGDIKSREILAKLF